MIDDVVVDDDINVDVVVKVYVSVDDVNVDDVVDVEVDDDVDVKVVVDVDFDYTLKKG